MSQSARHLVFLLILAAPLCYSEPLLDEIVVTAAKSEQQRRSILSSTGLVDSQSLENISHTHISEALHRIAGTWISRGNGQEHLTAIRSPVLTGAGSCGAFLMAQDGISLRAPGFCNVNELFEGTTELADRIEVVKGPNSSVYGSNALHGMINILTPGPDAGLRRLKFEAGPDDYYRTRLSVSSRNTRLDLSGTSDGGYKDDSGFDQQKLLLRHDRHGNGYSMETTFSYTNLNQETAGFIVGHNSYRQSGDRRDNPNPEAYRDARSVRLVSKISRSLASGELTLTPYLRSVDMEFLQHFLPGQAIEENGHDSVGLQTLWSNDSGSWQLGMELEYTDGFLKEIQPGPTTGSAFLAGTIPQGRHYDYEVDAKLAGVFTRYEMLLGEETKLVAGLRYQYMEYDYNNRMLDGRTREDGTPCGFGGCRFSRPGDRSDTFTDFSPRIGLIHNLNPQSQLYASLSRGFRAPQATELYRLQAGQVITEIDSVELDALELGYRGSAASLNWDLSIYRMEKDNFIFRDTSRRNVDNGETSHEGLELMLDWSLTPALQAQFAFTWARHRYENNPALSAAELKGNDIDTAPRTLGSLELSWQASESVGLAFEWTHIGSYYEDPENLNDYPGHDLLHLRGTWQFNERIQLSARLMNLADERYAERADFAFGNDRYFVGTPRSLYLGISAAL